MVSGGNRPGAPQNNPANISATGGAGQMAKQPTRYIPDMKSLGSTGVETAALQGAAPLSAGSAETPSASLPDVTPITAASTNPGENIMAGNKIGGGSGQEAMGSMPTGPSQDPDIELVRTYLPVIEWWASQPGSSQGTKDYVKYLGTII